MFMAVVNLSIPSPTAEQSVSEQGSFGELFAGCLQHSGGCWGKIPLMKANLTTRSFLEFNKNWMDLEADVLPSGPEVVMVVFWLDCVVVAEGKWGTGE